jgi:hypothetical protein
MGGGSSWLIGIYTESSNAFLSRVVGQERLHCSVNPHAFFHYVNPNLGPEYPELLNRLLDVLLKAPRIAVVLWELFAQARPGDDSFTLSAVASVDEKGQ